MPTTSPARRRFYRLSPGERGAAILPLVGLPVTGEYRAGNARKPFTGILVGIAADPVRQLPVVVIDQDRGSLMVLNLSSLYDIDKQPTTSHEPAPGNTIRA